MGKKRQQVLLASLVAAGILLLALPAEQRRDGFDAVNAAAQAVAGVQTEKKPEPEAPATPEREEQSAPEQKDDGGQKATEKPAPEPTATEQKPSTPDAEATQAGTKPGSDLGPGKSLRTTGSEVVALTFDDGPDPVQTPKILELLDQYQVKATFCLVGTQVERHPEIVRQIAARGHTLCNHTWDHSLKIGKDSPAKIQADLQRTNAAIQAAVPDAKIPFFRAPGGNFTERLVTVAGRSGMTSLYWEVDPRDWDHPEKETEKQHITRVVSEIQKQVRPGAIVLSHDFNQPATITAYGKLLPWLAENFTLGIPGEQEESSPEKPEPDSPQPSVTPTAGT
ncbi:polysaccharide deacetylase family protein [Actinoplanes sp. LDG1-06]|uniref:Polysaccharide deacetylase family protein n=2 Tax=Paractinoplanes ovalisporus TaxID=2810368 RepID=A0ABS2AMW4_9ACTN|nr:polysaccharide deacetylase family protein [Actinoplanes ovalisporus]